MKRTFRLLAIAAVSMMVAVACNNAPEATEDTTAIDTTPVEAVVEDTTPVLDTVPAVEEQAPAKKTTKTTKKETKVTPVNAADRTIDDTKTGTNSFTKTATKKNENQANAADGNLDNKAGGSFGKKKN